MQRITFAGEALADLPVEEPGEYISLIWPAPGTTDTVLPEVGNWRTTGRTAEQHARNYTVRRFDADRGRLEIDFFVHGDHGRAARWASVAAPGDTLGFGGTRLHWVTDPDADWVLLVGDETALPAVAAIVDERGADRPTVAVVEVRDAGEHQALDIDSGAELRFVHRGAREPGCGLALADAVRGLSLPEGRPQAWVGGESLVVRSIREHLHDARGLPSEAVSALGYWKRT